MYKKDKVAQVRGGAAVLKLEMCFIFAHQLSHFLTVFEQAALQHKTLDEDDGAGGENANL